MNVQSISTMFRELQPDSTAFKVCACIPVVSHIVLAVKERQLLAISRYNRDLCPVVTTMYWLGTVQRLSMFPALLTHDPYIIGATLIYNVFSHWHNHTRWEQYKWERLSVRKKSF